MKQKHIKIIIFSLISFILQLNAVNVEVSAQASSGKNWNFEFANDSGHAGYVRVVYEQGPSIIELTPVENGQRVRIENVDLRKNLLVEFVAKTIFNTMSSTKYFITPNGKNVFIGIDFANKMMPQGGIFSGLMQKIASGIENKNNVSQEDVHFVSYNV